MTACGNGPFKMTLTISRRGDIAVFDWTGTDPQAEGPINFHIHEGLCKLFFGVYMIMSFDPSMLFNEGFYDLFEIVLPEGSLLNPRFPAALSNRLNTHTRFFDCQAGALGQFVPHLSMAAGYGTSPHFIFSGTDENGKYFQLMELLFGGVPGRPQGDGFDGHAWWPLFSATPIEYIENYYPVLVERYRPIQDSGGPGLHRGGAGIEKVYRLLEPGQVSIHDDREVVPPWGINGGLHGGTSSKWHSSARARRATPHSLQDRQSQGRARRPHHLQDRRFGRLGRSARPRPRRSSRATCATGWSRASRPQTAMASC